MNDSQVFFLCGMWKLPTIFQRPCCCLCLGSKVDKSLTEKAQSWLFFQFLGGTCDNSANMTQQIQFFESPVWCVIQFLKWLWSQVFWGPSNHHKVSSHSFRSHTMFKGPKKEIIKNVTLLPDKMWTFGIVWDPFYVSKALDSKDTLSWKALLKVNPISKQKNWSTQ